MTARDTVPTRSLLHRAQRAVTTPEGLLRTSLGLVYLWFGALKAVEAAPVLDLLRAASPTLATVPLYCLLTLFELVVGVMLLGGLRLRWAAAAVTLHLLGTFGATLTTPSITFAPGFPFLTLEGEFVLKNLVLLAAAASLFLGVRKAPKGPRDVG